MKVIITENQYQFLIESLIDDNEFRNLIKSYESTVKNSKGQHYVFDDKDPNQTKKFVTTKKSPYGGTLTIGWGHTGEYARPGNIISNSTAEKLLSNDIKKHEEVAIKLFPKYSKYPLYVQRALLNSVFRGEAKSTYKWVQSINSGNWSLGAKQYLEGWNVDFSTVGDPKYKGTVAERMKNNQKAFLKYTSELSPKKNDNIYVVKSGDTLSGIVSKMGGGITIDTVMKLNKLKSDKIVPGQKLKLK